MVNSETVRRLGRVEAAGEGSQRPDIFALVADFYAAARAQEDRRLLRDMLGQIISGLRDQFEIERRMLMCRPVQHSALEDRERTFAQVLAELQEFFDRAESDDEPGATLAHALDGLVIRQLRGELRLPS